MSEKSIWCIDTNVLASWILVEGRLLESVVKNSNVPANYADLYREKYSHDITFINLILAAETSELLKDNEIYIPFLATNELFSALKDEIICLKLFEKGDPVSTWPRNKAHQSLKDGEERLIFETVLRMIDQLLENGVTIIEDSTDVPHNNFWDVFASLLLKTENTRTQDVMLLTTSVLNGADYFVTRDERLIQALKKTMKTEYDLTRLSSSSALSELKKKIRK
ncbi:MAG: hypothetical protein MJ005_03675 [Methanocorpusculum sp.]|nr:hypothetical protein [archaeon]MCQ2357851.1 hypothetical protein [Methanocorpusculum sp.]HJJ44872.1 hypothetical protein [Methanocorpusculum sp.]